MSENMKLTTDEDPRARDGREAFWHRRRVIVWLLAVTAVTACLIAQQWLPQWSLAPQHVEFGGVGLLLVLFFGAMVCEFVDSGLGMGYGTTLTPLLLLVGFKPLQVVPCVLLSEFITGMLAGIMHHRDGNVDLLRDRVARSTLGWLSLLSAGGALLAVTLAVTVPGVWLKGIIGVIILSIGVTVLATLRRRLKYRRAHIIGIGAVAAFNKGLSGGGYGPLVCAGQVVSGVPPRSAVAITSVAESLTCLVGLIAYLAFRGGLDVGLLVPLCLGACLSVPMATLVIRRMPEMWVRLSVGVTTVLLGGLVLLKLVL